MRNEPSLTTVTEVPIMTQLVWVWVWVRDEVLVRAGVDITSIEVHNVLVSEG